jgi:hypothetical protein
MASRKAVKKAKTVRRSGVGKPIQLPDGYKVIEYAPNWDHEKNPVIKGVRGETKDMTFARGTPNEYQAECFSVNDKDVGEVTVWKSSGLIRLFEETDAGDDIFIEFTGYGEARDSESDPPKLFRCGAKPSKRNPF